MRVVFIGSQQLGYSCLKELLKEDEVSAVFTMAPGEHEIWKEDVKRCAEENNILVYVDKNINNYVEELRSMDLDAVFVVGWRKIISKDVLNVSKLGCFGIHCSLLPEYRGNAPFTWPVIRGESRTGTTLFKMDEKADTGPIVAQRECEIYDNDTGRSLQERLFNLSIEMFKEVLPLFRKGKIPLKLQKEANFSYFGPRRPRDGLIDWNSSTRDVYNLIRALAPPFPMAFTYYKGKRIRIKKASIIDGYYGVPSSVVTKIGDKLVIATQDGAVLVEELEAEEDLDIDSIKSGELFGESIQSLTQRINDLEKK